MTFHHDLAGTPDGLERLRELAGQALAMLADTAKDREGPVRPGGPQEAITAAQTILDGRILPEDGIKPEEWVSTVLEGYAHWAVDLTHPAAVSRMQCPPTVAAATAELVTSVVNQSLHAWESGPFALELERRLIAEIADLVGYGPGASGTLTPGGSVSNFMALLLAREHADLGIEGTATVAGLSGAPRRPRILSSRSSHFSVARGAGFAGLGRESVIAVPVDEEGRMDVRATAGLLDALGEDEVPLALVATAGTTDFAVFDPIPALADLAAERGIWLHVDAAYGLGALFSRRLRPLIEGLERADSITFDAHKLGWTPASASFLLVRDGRHLGPLTERSSYLTPIDDEEAGFSSLLGTSLQTTRRADALKIAATLGVLGRRGMEEWVDHCHELACHAARRIAADDRFELAADPILTTVVFRWKEVDGSGLDDFNAELRRRLMSEGKVLVARTTVERPDEEPAVHLKLIFLNPATSVRDVDELLAVLTAAAEELAVSLSESRPVGAGT
jgi:L-2,4-diaminobutyrate decarboxylase